MEYIPGHYDGKHIVPDKKVSLKKNQKVIITVLKENKNERKNINVAKYRGLAKGVWGIDAQKYVKELRDEDRS